MHLNLMGRTALVTGASGDIGAAISRVLAEGEAQLVLHYNSSVDAVKALSQETIFKHNQHTILQADLTSETATDTLFNEAEKTLAPVDTLICNAGYLDKISTPLTDMTLDQWNRTIDRNLTATFLTIRRFLRGVENAKIKDPSIVIIGSMSGVWGQPGHADYAAAKAAMVAGLTPTIKDEIVRIAPRGRANTIAPGFIVTQMVADQLQDTEAMTKVLQTASLRKFGTPDDVANMAGFLASNSLSGHITGEVIRMAGGKEGRVLFDPSEITLAENN